MNIDSLYRDLLKAWSDENLNRISAKLINLYKQRKYEQLRGIVNRISTHVSIDEARDSKCFSRLIMLYHPDKGNIYRDEIKALYNAGNLEKLLTWRHIELLDEMDLRPVYSMDPDIEFTPEYTWDNRQSSGYRIYDHEDDNHIDFNEYFDVEPNVFNAIKLREYGDLSIELPSYYLEDLDELELAYQGIEMLDGIEFCKNMAILDLSHNGFNDIDLLWDLKLLEEIYLSENSIEEIGTLSNLQHLRIIDLSGNNINDISPLFELGQLTFVNLLGNPVEEEQVNMLKNQGVVVLW